MNTNTVPSQVQDYWWIAINGASAAMSPCRMPLTLKCTPTPRHLIGIVDYEIAKEFQAILLTAPVGNLQKAFDALRQRLARQHDDVAYIEPDNPEPFTTKVAAWVFEPQPNVFVIQESPIRTKRFHGNDEQVRPTTSDE